MATTNLSALLLGELQALSTEARRKHPEIKEAAERVIVTLRGIRATTSAEIAAELAESDEVISPFVLSCKSNSHRLASMSVQCLQQLISYRAVSPRSIKQTLSTLNTVIHLGVDIQVKILQMVLPLVTMYDNCVYGETLVDALHLCLALQKSRDLVVSNTAAAILQQVVVAVFDRVVTEDREHADDNDSDDNRDTRENDLTRTFAKDAFFVLQDLCLLVAGSDSIFIRIESVDQGLILELIESVLANHAAVVARHTAMLQILRERLAPFIVHFFAEKASFTLTVRCIRVVWLFIRDLHADLPPECEMLLSILTRLVDPTSSSSSKNNTQLAKTALTSGFPLFYRVLAMEVLRNTLSNTKLLHQLYKQFDGRKVTGNGLEDCHVITDIIKAVGKAAVERPELRTSSSDGIPDTGSAGSAADDGSDTTDSKQVGAHSCSLRIEMHKLLDKHEPPLMPEPYLAYLAFTAILSIVNGLAEQILPLCSENVVCHAPAKIRSPGSVLDPDLAASLKDEHVLAIKSLVQESWSVLLSVYTFYLAVCVDDLLFRRIMDTMQKLVQVSGAFGLNEARDGFLILLCRSCLPQAAIADHERQLQQGHPRKSIGRSPSGEPTVNNSDEPAATQTALPLVTTSLAGTAFTLNRRQVECLRAVIGCAQYLGAVLGPMWYPVLVTLQQADDLLFQSRSMPSAAAISGGATGSTTSHSNGQKSTAPSRRASVLAAAGSATKKDETGQLVSSELALVRSDYMRMLGFVRTCGRDAIVWAMGALCILGADLSTVPADVEFQSEEKSMRTMPRIIHRRLSAVLNRPTFAIELLREFAVGNADLLVRASADASKGKGVWQMVMRHLLATATHLHAPAAMRTQACCAVSDIVLKAMDFVSLAESQSTDESEQLAPNFIEEVASGEAQVSILTPLLQMMRGTAGEGLDQGARFVDVSKLTLDTVYQLLQASGRSIRRAWGVVFDIILSVLEEPPSSSVAAETLAGTESRKPGYLMRCVFPCLQLICSDYLEDLPPHCLRRCVECLALFGGQNEDLNIALTAVGQTWTLCDFFQRLESSSLSGNKNASELVSSTLVAATNKNKTGSLAVAEAWWNEELGELSARRTQQVLWVLLLHSLAQLGCDRRHEVRLGAIQTLFRTLDMHGNAFDKWLWDAVVWAVVLPLARYVLTQRAHVFKLVREHRLDELLEDAQDEAARIANQSGVVVEDPARLYGKQWDETVATALQGASRVWAMSQAAVEDIGCADQAWQCIWQLIQAFYVGEPAAAICQCLPTSESEPNVQVSADFVHAQAATRTAEAAEVAIQRAQLRTRDSMAAATECVSALARSQKLATEPGWRIAWKAWLGMGALVTAVPESAGSDFNEDGHGAVVVTQEALCAFLRLSATIVNVQGGIEWFTETDAQALLQLAQVVLMYVDIPLQAADDCKMAAVQTQVLDIVLLILDDNVRNGGLDSAAATALAAADLAKLAVLPYVVQEQQGVLSSSTVVQKTRALFFPMVSRLNALDSTFSGQPERKRMGRAVRPTFCALATSALDHLGRMLSSMSSEVLLAQILLSGVWQDAIVAMGMHMVVPLAPEYQERASDWFRGVSAEMKQLRQAAANADADASEALASAWTAVGSVLALAMDIPREILELHEDCSSSSQYERRTISETSSCGLAATAQIRILDTIAAASLQYVAEESADAEQPIEMATFWPMLVRILEWGAVAAPEPVVLLGTDGGVDVQGLTMACFTWLFRMASHVADGGSAAGWVSKAAAPALVRRSAMVLDAFVSDRRLVGKSPLPQSRIVLVRLVLQGLAQLQCHPAALKHTAGSGLPMRAASGTAAHIFALYDNLVGLVAVPDPEILLLVQQCLKRVSSEIFG
ncbi:Endocytosis and vacuole integrity protein [Coemansia brasiliensis]|uniref:Endocytosis and vacuole integrity protein n=1 Tax=Coemansia brasiliensis TaxID=2650707 RepID=A0A9W8IHG6_9FUNG|nr:Endocytosis and vacuole integrity protein [Coemansia brasiliensis]